MCVSTLRQAQGPQFMLEKQWDSVALQMGYVAEAADSLLLILCALSQACVVQHWGSTHKSATHWQATDSPDMHWLQAQKCRTTKLAVTFVCIRLERHRQWHHL